MIPQSAADLDELVEEARRQSASVAETLGGLSSEAARWRPDPTRWSVAGHVAHLSLVNAPYLDSMAGKVEAARASGGPRSDGPYRHPFIARRFVGMLAPPPKRRVKTFRSMTPDPDVTGGDAADEFARNQGRLVSLLDEARGLDLGRIRFGSPFFAPLRFSLGTGFATVLVHNRRHLWLIDELLANPAFPDG